MTKADLVERVTTQISRTAGPMISKKDCARVVDAFLEAIKEFPTSCGDVGWNAMRNIATLLAEFRRNEWPVLYPHVAPKNKATDGGRLAEKVPAIMNVPAKGYEFPAEIAPREGDVLIPKKHPSAFFATPLASHLIDLGADTLVVTGCTTSGCVRGSVVDAFAFNFRSLVPHDAVYDRCNASHAVNLFDMAAKYACVTRFVFNGKENFDSRSSAPARW